MPNRAPEKLVNTASLRRSLGSLNLKTLGTRVVIFFPPERKARESQSHPQGFSLLIGQEKLWERGWRESMGREKEQQIERVGEGEGRRESYLFFAYPVLSSSP